MMKFTAEKFIEKLREIPAVSVAESQAQEQSSRSSGGQYLMDVLCMPILREGEIEISLDYTKFSLAEVNDIIDEFYGSKFERFSKVDKLAAYFEKCKPAIRKAAFI
jgi:hypothetical protein